VDAKLDGHHMTEPWDRSTCPLCERHSEGAKRLAAIELPQGLGTQMSVQHQHGNGVHVWYVRWTDDSKVSA
jgi:hypothetical protein